MTSLAIHSRFPQVNNYRPLHELWNFGILQSGNVSYLKIENTKITFTSNPSKGFHLLTHFNIFCDVIGMEA